jgi:hypothetical protein
MPLNFGLTNEKFYIDYTSTSRPVGNIREESNKRAVELAESSNKLLLGLSGGLDSQSVLHSFYSQGIPIETILFYSPGYNDIEYEQVKILDKKYGIKTQIIDADPMEWHAEIDQLSIELDIPAKQNLIHRKFLSMVSSDYDFIQVFHDPMVIVGSTEKTYFCHGYYHPEMLRARAFESLNRTGKNIFYGNTPEQMLSILNDDIFKAAYSSYKYFDGNGLIAPLMHPKTSDRWDIYIKPLIFGKYWGDELIYFPKYGGGENIRYAHAGVSYRYWMRNKAVAIPLNEFVDFLKIPNGSVKRYFENTTPAGYEKEEVIKQILNHSNILAKDATTLFEESERLKQVAKDYSK